MRPYNRGFTLVELMVGLVILSVLLAVGVPSMRSWLLANNAQASSEFYAEGLRMARSEAVKRNAVTRMILTPNTTSGQMDWQVDLCVPTPSASCTDASGSWSTTTSVNSDAHSTDFKSVQRLATKLPPTSAMTLTTSPSGATTVYFTPLGWVNTAFANSLTMITLAPVTANAFPTGAVAVTLAGTVNKCLPGAAAGDSRRCP